MPSLSFNKRQLIARQININDSLKLLLIRNDSYLDLGLDVLDGIRRFNLQGDCLASQRLDEDLHATAEAQDQMQG